MSKRDAIVFGVRAVQALAKYRPKSILRVMYCADVKMSLGMVLKVTAAHRKPYREVQREDLDRICSTTHHEGVVAIAQPFELPFLNDVQNQLGAAQKIIMLDDVANPHNVGAVARTAAWFGYDALVLKSDSQTLNPASVRVSQGGVFAIRCFRVSRLVPALKSLSDDGVSNYALVQHGKLSLREVSPPKRCCLVFGNERFGLAPETAQVCENKVRIDGSGQVESLNIGVAAGIAMAHFI